MFLQGKIARYSRLKKFIYGYNKAQRHFKCLEFGWLYPNTGFDQSEHALYTYSFINIFNFPGNNCRPNPCQNAAKCLIDLKRMDGYRCQCTSDFTGRHCQGTRAHSSRIKKTKLSRRYLQPRWVYYRLAASWFVRRHSTTLHFVQLFNLLAGWLMLERFEEQCNNKYVN